MFRLSNYFIDPSEKIINAFSSEFIRIFLNCNVDMADNFNMVTTLKNAFNIFVCA